MNRRRTQAPKRMSPLARFAVAHARACLFSLGQIWRSAGNSLMSAAVIGIALTLPGALWLMLANVGALVGDTDAQARLSAFVQPGTPAQALEALSARIRERPEVLEVRLVPAAEGLARLQASLGLGDLVELLPENPLPDVLVVTPRRAASGPGPVRSLATALERMDAVSEVSIDLAWLQRLQALTRLGRRLAVLTALLVAIGVVLVVGNTIRVAISSRRPEIEIQQLFGATERFVRLPFIYTGLLLGLAGGLLAMLVCEAGVAWLQPAVAEVLRLYAAGQQLRGLGALPGLVLIGSGALMGALGARIAVGRHIGRSGTAN